MIFWGVFFRLPCYQKNFITLDNDELLLDVSRSYVAQTMQQFHVLIRSTTVLGNQCGYNFKSPGDTFYESNTVNLHWSCYTRNSLVFFIWMIVHKRLFAVNSVWGRHSRKIEPRGSMSIGLRYSRYYANISL